MIIPDLALFGNYLNENNDRSIRKIISPIDGLFDSRENKPGCAVGVIKDGEYIHNKGYGMANLEHDIAITSDTIFRIGSVRKQFNQG